MRHVPDFAKPDRYKASSYRAYNYTLPERYDTCFWMRFCQVSRWDEAIRAEIGPEIESARILDVGCATGRLLDYLARAGAKDLAGVDLAPRIVDMAREKLANLDVEADLRCADAEDQMPWPSGCFDVALLTGVLHHFYRPQDALREIRRVLRPAGRLLIVDPDFVMGIRQVCNLALRLAPHWGDCRLYSRQLAIRLIENAGLRVLAPRSIGLWSYLVSAVKEV
jgi:ubiquinone/menaquinone biosynthesis C-methylase UbiE